MVGEPFGLGVDEVVVVLCSPHHLAIGNLHLPGDVVDGQTVLFEQIDGQIGWSENHLVSAWTRSSLSFVRRTTLRLETFTCQEMSWMVRPFCLSRSMVRSDGRRTIWSRRGRGRRCPLFAAPPCDWKPSPARRCRGWSDRSV